MPRIDLDSMTMEERPAKIECDCGAIFPPSLTNEITQCPKCKMGVWSTRSVKIAIGEGNLSFDGESVADLAGATMVVKDEPRKGVIVEHADPDCSDCGGSGDIDMLVNLAVCDCVRKRVFLGCMEDLDAGKVTAADFRELPEEEPEDNGKDHYYAGQAVAQGQMTWEEAHDALAKGAPGPQMVDGFIHADEPEVQDESSPLPVKMPNFQTSDALKNLLDKYQATHMVSPFAFTAEQVARIINNGEPGYAFNHQPWMKEALEEINVRSPIDVRGGEIISDQKIGDDYKPIVQFIAGYLTTNLTGRIQRQLAIAYENIIPDVHWKTLNMTSLAINFLDPWKKTAIREFDKTAHGEPRDILSGISSEVELRYLAETMSVRMRIITSPVFETLKERQAEDRIHRRGAQIQPEIHEYNALLGEIKLPESHETAIRPMAGITKEMFDKAWEDSGYGEAVLSMERAMKAKADVVQEACDNAGDGGDRKPVDLDSILDKYNGGG